MRANKQLLLACIIMPLLSCACSGNSSGIGPKSPNTPVHQNIRAETAYQMMQQSQNYMLLDVRTMEEFMENRIDGAILIPDYELKKRAASELPDKDALILIYCRSGIRASGAPKVLGEEGYTQVYNFGGIIDWPYGTVGEKR